MVFVAYADGANDNFKGVATLFGRGTPIIAKPLDGRPNTFTGSMPAFFLATRLISIFQGKVSACLTVPVAGISAGVIYSALSWLLAT